MNKNTSQEFHEGYFKNVPCVLN